MKLLPSLLRFVQMTSIKHKIDESHSLGHSMEVLHYVNHIYMDNIFKYPELYNQEKVIYTSAIIHDMCDKKYLNQTDGICEINNLLENKMNAFEMNKVDEIIGTMSYSTVKKNGFPNLGEYQMAYHIVREADLLASYDFDRSVIYHLNRGNNLTSSYYNALEIFYERVPILKNEEELQSYIKNETAKLYELNSSNGKFITNIINVMIKIIL